MVADGASVVDLITYVLDAVGYREHLRTLKVKAKQKASKVCRFGKEGVVGASWLCVGERRPNRNGDGLPRRGQRLLFCQTPSHPA